MDFLDFEDNRVAEILEQVENGTLTAEDGVIELLDEEDLLQELRANADLVTFFRDHPEAVVACALVRDGEGQSGDTETLEPDRPTRRDRRGGVAAEVLTGEDGACSSVAKACAACDGCWDRLAAFLDDDDDDDATPMRANRWERVLAALLRSGRFAATNALGRADFLEGLPKRLASSWAAGQVGAMMLRDAFGGKLVACAAPPPFLRASAAALGDGRGARNGRTMFLGALADAAARERCAAALAGDPETLAALVAAAEATAEACDVLSALVAAVADDRSLRRVVAGAVAPRRAALLLRPDAPRGEVGADLLARARLLRAAARCAAVADALAAPDALNFYVDRFFDLPACTMLHNAVTAAVLAVLADEPRRADAAAVLDALLFRTGECAHSDDASRGLLKRAAHAIRVARADGRHVTLSRDANLVVIAEAVCAALRQDPDDGGDREPLIPDLLFRRRPELDAWLHFAASVLSLETARKVVLAEPPKSSFREVR